MNSCFVTFDFVDSSFTVTYGGRVFDVRPTLVLDFDGTVCTGDGPVWSYAEAAFALLSSGEPEIAGLRAELTRFLAGEPGGPHHPDGYAAVAALVEGRVTTAELDRAYLTSRGALATGPGELSSPDGLADMLGKLAGRVDRLLVTNAPPDGLPETLARLGLDGVIDAIHPNAGKPAGMGPILDELLAHRQPAQVLSVGDFHANDIAIPLARGCVTAFIDRFDQRTGPAHLRAATFEQLYDGVLAWADDPAGFAGTHAPIGNLIEEPV